jgi:hypothetical protein
MKSEENNHFRKGTTRSFICYYIYIHLRCDAVKFSSSITVITPRDLNAWCNFPSFIFLEQRIQIY